MPIPAYIFPLSHRAYQCCHTQHLRRVRNTRTVEHSGRALMALPTLTIPVVRNFTEAVCIWGGKTGYRVLGRIRREHDHIVLRSFQAARAALLHGNITQAMSSIQNIKGLGQFSYSSKHLRMLAPDQCAVFDNLVENFVHPYMPHADRWTMFLDYCAFCRDKAVELTNARVKLGDYASPCTGSESEVEIDASGSQSTWTAADVDMAIFAWIQRWCTISGTDSSSAERKKPKTQIGDRSVNAGVESPVAKQSSRGQSRVLYLCQKHEKDEAVTIKESCDSNWNNAWICRKHGSLDLKKQGARGTTVYMIGEILRQGTDATIDTRWEESPDGATCHHDGAGYKGRLRMESVGEAVRYLKSFFVIHACPCNTTETQAWIDNL